MEFEVIKEYAGIKVGSIVRFRDSQTEEYMINKGYVKEIPMTSKKVEPTQRKKKKKVDPGMGERKTK